jgi:ABC-2 type transport system ATP-binding protein
MAAVMIEVCDLVKVFGAFTAVDRISLRVPEGEIRAFLGPNGAGKTTTIRILTTMLAPTAGRIRVGGHDPVREQQLVRRSFGIVFQDPSLDDELTAWENMALHGILYGLPRTALREGVASLLDFVGLWPRRHDYVKKFSGGMKRRLEIARALLHRPRLLFLDEPTHGLDPQTRGVIWEFVRGLAAERQVTVFFTTHAMEEAERVADAITVIDHGRIVAEGSAAALKERTQSGTLEQAFIALTGRSIRDEEANPGDRMRLIRRAWRGR